ncbi:amino acid transporter, partial [Streptomyces sp. ATMOS53]
KEFEPGGQANGRALAYLSHEYLGNAFGTVYDVSTIAILWFAGASAMAGLLNLMPRYLPRYGMAPHWARAVRPMVIVFTLVAFLVTWIFDADVDAQGGAYATGVLVLMSSAAIAVTIAARKAGQRNWTIAFAVVSAVLLYVTVANVIERPDGVKIGACFIAGIILVSLLSRLARAFELRVTSVTLDDMAERFIRDMASRKIRFIANEPDRRDKAEYRDKIEQIR